LNPIYIAFAVVVLVLIAVVVALIILLVRQQEHTNKVHDDLINRLMTHTWEDYVVNRRAEAADQGPRKAEWQPGDKKPDKLDIPYDTVLGEVR